MKYTLLSLIFIFLLSDTVEAHKNNNGTPTIHPIISTHFGLGEEGDKISVYPNPATDYFMLKNAENATKLLIYNIVGRQVKSFQTSGGSEKYTVNDLPKGMYVIRLLNDNNDLVETLRLNIR